MSGPPSETSAGDIFDEITRRQHFEDMVPRMREVHEHDRNKTEGGTLTLNTLRPGEEVRLEFYPTAEEPDPDPVILQVTKVGENSIKALASGGLLKWEDKEVGVGHSAFSPFGSMARFGVLEVGLYPELNYHDQEKVNAAEKQIAEIWKDGHFVFINGIRFDDKYFDEYRTDLNIPTAKERVHWLAENNHFGNAKLIPGKLADFRVEKPEPIELPKSG